MLFSSHSSLHYSRSRGTGRRLAGSYCGSAGLRDNRRRGHTSTFHRHTDSSAAVVPCLPQVRDIYGSSRTPGDGIRLPWVFICFGNQRLTTPGGCFYAPRWLLRRSWVSAVYSSVCMLSPLHAVHLLGPYLPQRNPQRYRTEHPYRVMP